MNIRRAGKSGELKKDLILLERNTNNVVVNDHLRIIPVLAIHLISPPAMEAG